MCGRFALTVSARVLAEVFDTPPPQELQPRYNIAPTQQIPVVRLDRQGRREMPLVRWGLLPHWAKDVSVGARLINARGETVASKPSFRAAYRRRRCLVPATAFYEWRREGTVKQPYLVGFSDGRVFAFAGLWESWSPPDGAEAVESCTIVTTRPNALLARVHDRMPVILPPAACDSWLGPQAPSEDELAKLLEPHPEAGMDAWPVSRRVNRPTNDDPQCVQPTGPSLTASS